MIGILLESYIQWTLFSIGIGVTEGAFFAHGGSLTRWPYNIHSWLLIPRILVGAFILWDAIPFLTFWGSISMILGMMGIFPFWHDGALYQTRHYLDFPPYNFFSESDTTTANFSLNFIWRLIFFIGGNISYLGAWYILV